MAGNPCAATGWSRTSWRSATTTTDAWRSSSRPSRSSRTWWTRRCRSSASAATPTAPSALTVTIEQYETAHSTPNRFTVKPGHVYKDVEFVTEQHDHYWVVEKHPGEMPVD